MAYQIVQCEVVWIASYQNTDSEGRPNLEYYKVGEFEDKGDADRAMAEAGFTRDGLYSWTGNYQWGSVVRILREINGAN
jgi:hypothetical protein